MASSKKRERRRREEQTVRKEFAKYSTAERKEYSTV